MEVSLSQLIMNISNLEKELSQKQNEIFNNSILKIDRELDGTETNLTINIKDFNQVYEDYTDTIKLLNLCKKTLSKANNTVMINDNMTISDALTEINILRKLSNTLDKLSNNEETTKRYSDGNGISSYYKITRPNYNINDVKKNKKQIDDSIMMIEVLIQEANAKNIVTI